MQKCVSISFFTLNALNIKHDERNYFKTNSNPIAAAASHHNLRLFQHRNIIHLLLVYCGGPTPWYLLPDVNAGWKPVCVSFRSRLKIRSSLSLSPDATAYSTIHKCLCDCYYRLRRRRRRRMIY